MSRNKMLKSEGVTRKNSGERNKKQKVFNARENLAEKWSKQALKRAKLREERFRIYEDRKVINSIITDRNQWEK